MQSVILKKIIDGTALVMSAILLVCLYALAWSQVGAKWSAMLAFTIFVFGGVAYINKRRWRRLWFWGLLGALLLAHLTVYFVLLTQRTNWPLGYYALGTPIEIFAIAFVIEKAAQLKREP